MPTNYYSDDGSAYRDTPPTETRNDLFTIDARTFGVPVPPGYGCISGCVSCRSFRNKVRAERIKWQKKQDDWLKVFFGRTAGVYAPAVDNGIAVAAWKGSTESPGAPEPEPEPEVVSSTLRVDDLDPVERIHAAINLAHTDFSTPELNRRAERLIAELLG